ncbi:NAD(+) diphosphatase [Marinobacterium lutimaris]|uniref:NAD(+) diphosphatase n=1 Tax=Marinobacterium lutimaris TaxID=568106 RepID=A0A1H5WMH6_9GAMM|nr:NAD(+) diphosphatase [Marinobacterium lutimaris]SEG00505.1 NAD+ diphosphatase [Marinobacterium lutimaris]
MEYVLGHQGRLYVYDGGPLFTPEPAVATEQIEERYPVASELELVLSKAPPEGFVPLDLRAELSMAEESHFSRLARATQIAVWHDQHRFCGRCGTVSASVRGELAKRCPSCELVVYPRISPCIIVLVTRGDQCLLAHNTRFPDGRYSTLAGFIEAGETAEAAVAREIMEEVGVEVSNIRYAHSQAWPFPHSLMLGFYADYAGGEITPDGEEIDLAGWFSVDNLPQLPPEFTISRQLIEGFLQRQD